MCIRDRTWGAGGIIEGNYYLKCFKDFYFLTPPEQLIYTHFPNEARWQLLKHPVNQKQFSAYPIVRESFFESGLQLVALPSEYKVLPDSHYQVILKGPAGLNVCAQVGEAEGDRSTLVSRVGDRYTCLLYTSRCV